MRGVGRGGKGWGGVIGKGREGGMGRGDGKGKAGEGAFRQIKIYDYTSAVNSQ